MDPIEAAAVDVVERILLDLSDRRGIGNELDAIDDDVREEMVDTLRAEARAALAAYRDSEIEALRAKHADCQAVIRHKGHDADCPARACSFVGFASRCSQSPAWHKVVKVGHEYQSPPCSCGYSRCVEGGE